MMRRLATFGLAIVFLGVFGCQDVTEPGPDSPDFARTGQSTVDVIVLLDSQLAPGPHTANQDRAAEVAADLGVDVRHTYGTAVFGFSGTVAAGAVAALERDRRVTRVEPVEAWELAVDFAALAAAAQSSSQVLPTGVDRAEVDLNPTVTTDGTGVTVAHDIAIIDTGIHPDHEDLNVAGGRNFANGGADNWGDGNGHGTHVAGTVAAMDNDVGVVGVAPGAPVWAVRVCGNSGFCFTGDIVAGIDWVADQKASGAIDFAAANFSISSADDLSTCNNATNSVHQAICGLVNEGVVFGMAAGNDNRLKEPFPVAFSVSALADFDGKAGGAGEPTCRDDTDDTLADFSNFGEEVDIAAPGVCILSTWNDGGYNTISGTSMAAPHATGAVALYLHANGLAPAQDRAGADAIKNAIIDAAHPQGTDLEPCSYDDEKIGGPLLFTNAAAFGGDGSCEVATTEPAATGTLTGTVTDAETTDAIEGATVSVDGTDLSATTDANGSYTIEDVPEGTHDVTASADGYQSQTKEAAVTENETTTVDFALQAEEETTVGTVSVDDISYATSGGRTNDRHLHVTIALVDGDGNPVPDASVSAVLERDDGASWSFSGTTGSDGTVTFTLNNHGSGCYETTVTDVSADGLDWDGTTPANGYCKN